MAWHCPCPFSVGHQASGRVEARPNLCRRSLSPDEKSVMRKSIPGPTFKVDSSLPCGCSIRRDQGTSKLRLWYCSTHAVAFEVLEALRFNLGAIDDVIEHTPPGAYDLSRAMDAGMKARAAIRKASA